MSDHQSKEERLETKGFVLGISTGLEQAAGFLDKRSGEHYMRRDDAGARFYRLACDELVKLGREARERYDKEYPVQRRTGTERAKPTEPGERG